MFKKLFSMILTILIINISLLPAFAKREKLPDYNFNVKARLASKIDLNSSEEFQPVQFVTMQDVKNPMELVIPKGTTINGYITSLKTSKFGYRRANAKVVFENMVLPSGHKYDIAGGTKKKTIKGSAVLNTAKGVVTAPAAIVVGAAGGAVIVVEAVTIAGLLAVDKTSNSFGKVMDVLTKGINCSIKKGTPVNIKIVLIPGNDYTALLYNEGEQDYSNYILPVNNVSEIEKNDEQDSKSTIELNPLIEQALFEE